MASLVVGDEKPKKGRSPVKYVVGMPYKEMTCKMLRDELTKRGLKKSGKKADLIQRLENDDDKDTFNKKVVCKNPIIRQQSLQVPEPEALDLMCGITQDLLEDPVVTCDGHTYSRLAIERWLQASNKSPMTNIILSNKVLYPNLFAQKHVIKYKRKLGLKLIELIERKETDQVIGLLDDAKADLNVRRESDRKTPLLIACEMKLDGFVSLLIDNGADCDVTDADGKTIYDYMPNLKINWDKNKDILGEKDILKLKSNSLEKIYLGNNEIGDEEAKHLAEALKVNKSLKEIDLWSNKIGDEGAKHLAEALKVNTSLKEINLRYNNIGVEGAKHLAEMLKVNKTLELIILGSNNIGDEGAKELAEALKANTSLKEIELYENNIGAEGTKHLAEALKGYYITNEKFIKIML